MKKLINASYSLGLAAFSTVSLMFSLSVFWWDLTHEGKFPIGIREVAFMILVPSYVIAQLIFWAHMRLVPTDANELRYRTLLVKITNLTENAANAARELASAAAIEKLASADQASRIEITGEDSNRRLRKQEKI